MTKYHYNWTVTSKYYYDQTLTTGLIKNCLDDWLDSSGKDTERYSLYNMADLSVWPSDREKQHDTSYHYEDEGDADPVPEPPTNSTYHYYMNFKMATGINFADLRSSAAAAGLTSHGYIPNGLTLADNTSAGNITFDKNGGLSFEGSNTLAQDITFIDGGEVLFTDAGSGNQTLTGLLASKDLEYIDMGFVEQGGSSILSGGQVRRNLRHLNVGVSTNNPVSGKTGSGLLVDGLVVRGVLNSVYVASGASVNHLTVGLDRQWSGSDISAFVTTDSNGVPKPTYWGSETTMIIASGGTATNITLGNGGRVYVSGLSDTVSSTYNSTTSQWEYTTHYASGTGGILKDLNMASSGGLQFEGINDPRATWGYPLNGYSNSSSYMSGFLATAPQSSYVSFGSTASGSNINIGNGGSLYIGKGASVSAISMGGLVTSTFFKNSSGTTDTWIGDRGAKLQINGGYVSGVVMDPVLQTFDYYSAAHDYFWLYSSSLEREYYSSHNSTYPSGAAWSSSVLNSAVNGGYRQYMSAMYTSGAVYTNLGDDTAYERRYVGGAVGVNGGWVMNISGFSLLSVAADVDVTVSNHVSSWKTYQYTDGNVSKAIGAVSATLDVTGGAHVYNVKIEGGRVIMTGGGEVNARWHSRENKQSNYNLVEDLDLRIGDVLGLGSAYPAVIEFWGEGSGGYKQYISSGGTSGYVDYTWDAIDPGEIHSVTASKGLVVSANWTTHQDFTYIGSGAVTINGLGTVVLKDNHSRYTSDSYYGKGPYLGSAYDEYYFGVVKGVYNEEDGVLENYTVLDGTDGAFDWTGFLTVGSGGIVRNIGSAAPLKTGNDIVNSDTWTPSYTRDECKVLTVVAGGSADNVTVKGAVRNFEHNESQYTESRAGLLVSSGGMATNVTVLEGGIAMAKGGTIDKVFVAGGGTLYLSGWAGAHQVGESSAGHVELSGPQYLDTTVLNAVRLDSGGQLTNTLDWGFRTGGHAPSVIANAGGGILNGVTANGVAYVSGLDYAGAITLTKDQQAVDVTVRGYKNITSRDAEGNPTAYNTTIASLNVSSGGIVKGATVGEEGAIYVSEGADVSGLSASGGRIIFENAGSGWGNYFPASATVTGLAVEAGGVLEVNSKFGLTASNVRIGENAGLTFTLGDTASEDYTPTALNGTWTAAWGNGSFYTDDGTMSGFGGQFGQEYKDLFYSSSYVSARLSMTVAKGGILTGADLRGYGSVQVTSGGKIFNTKIKGVGVSINSGGYASGLSALTDPDRTANQTQIWAYGSGATLDDTVLNGGLLGLEVGAVANGVVMTAPEGYTGGPGDAKTYGPAELDIEAGGTANNVVASAGVITLDGGSSKEPGTAGATLNNADVHSSASIIVTTDDAIMTGTLNLGGTVNTTTERYEYVEVQVDDVDADGNPIHYTDWQRVKKNNATVDASNLTVNFDLTERKGDNTETVMIDNLANLQGATLSTITISGDQSYGQYVLAQGANDFTGTLTVNCDGRKIGDFSVGDVIQYSSDLVYSLTSSESIGLAFRIQTTQAAVDSILATVDGRELLKGQWTNQGIHIKAQVNQFGKSLWYRIRREVLYGGSAASPLTDGLMRRSAAAPADEGWIEIGLDDEIVVTEYCDVEFMTTDAQGRESSVVTYTANYDAAPAVISDFRSHAYNGQELNDGTSSDVSVLVKDDHDPEPKLELFRDGEWQEIQYYQGDNSRYYFTVTGNGDYQLRATDHAGNVANETVTVNFYDITEPPVVLSAAADTTELTNGNVTVTASFSGNSMRKEYAIDRGEWQSYAGPVTMTENGTVSFRAWNTIDYSETVSVEVGNIDKAAPVIQSVSQDTDGWTAGSILLTVNAVDEGVAGVDPTGYKYWDGSAWADLPDNTLAAAQNGAYTFAVYDNAGNVSGLYTHTVRNIDKEAPYIVSVSQNIDPAGNFLLTINAVDEGSGVDPTSYKYWDGSAWADLPGNTLVTAESGDYTFAVYDNVGNVSGLFTHTASNIDDTAPVIQSVTQNIDSVTASDVLLTVNAVDQGGSGLNPAGYKYWDANAGIWADLPGNTLVATQNGDYTFAVYDNAGNVSGLYTHTVGNIDKEAPYIVSVSQNIDPVTGNFLLTVNAVDEGVAGIDPTGYKYWDGGIGAWTDLPDNTLVATQSGAYTFAVYDNAGNVSGLYTHIASNIDGTAPVIESVSQSTDFLTAADVLLTINAVDQGGSGLNPAGYKYWDANAGIWADLPGNTLVATQNGDYTFAVYDNAGNVSGLYTHTVGNIDKEAPYIVSVSQDIDPVTGNFLLTVNAVDEGVAGIDPTGYKYWDGGIGAWTDLPGNTLVATQSGAYTFAVYDNAGNVSGLYTHIASNIDDTAPVIESVSQSTDFLTAADVLLTINAVDQGGSGVNPAGYKYWNANTGLWENLADNTLAVSQNGDYTFAVYDNAGNVSALYTHTVGNIDKDAPYIVSVSQGPDPETGNFLLTVNAVDEGVAGVDPTGYKYWDGSVGAWTDLPGNTLAVSQDGDYTFAVYDNAGNVSGIYTYRFSTVDNIAPVIESVSQSTDFLTSADVLLTINAVDQGGSGVDPTGYKYWNANTGLWENLPGNTLVATQNGDYTFAVYDNAGNVSALYTHTVGNIDKAAPVIQSVTQQVYDLNPSDFLLTINAEDQGVAGIDPTGYKYWDSNSGLWTNLPGNTLVTSDPGDYTFAVYDNAGNVSTLYTHTLTGLPASAAAPLTPGDNTNDTWQAAAGQEAALAGEVIEGWVGFGDAADFIKFQLAEAGQIRLGLDDVTANALADKQIGLTCLDTDGNSVATVLEGDTLFSEQDVLAGEYYLGVTCTDVKKYDTFYSVTVGGMLA